MYRCWAGPGQGSCWGSCKRQRPGAKMPPRLQPSAHAPPRLAFGGCSAATLPSSRSAKRFFSFSSRLRSSSRRRMASCLREGGRQEAGGTRAQRALPFSWLARASGWQEQPVAPHPSAQGRPQPAPNPAPPLPLFSLLPQPPLLSLLPPALLLDPAQQHCCALVCCVPRALSHLQLPQQLVLRKPPQARKAPHKHAPRPRTCAARPLLPRRAPAAPPARGSPPPVGQRTPPPAAPEGGARAGPGERQRK